MVNPWAPWVVFGLIVAAGLSGWVFAQRRRIRAEHQHVANSEYVASLPSFRKRLLIHRWAAASLTVLVAIAAGAAGLLAGQPVDRHVFDERLKSRDIVLCLDVSGSMAAVDGAVLEMFTKLLPSFRGERVSLVIWNGTARTVFPLTDDYAMVRAELERGAKLLRGFADFSVRSSDLLEWMEGTLSMGAGGSSLIADGLASCVMAFDQLATERSRSIIFATDNEPAGTSIFTLTEASEFARDRKVTVYGLYASRYAHSKSRDEFASAVKVTNGLTYSLKDPSAADGIIQAINREQAVALNARPKVVETDRPDRYYPLLLLAVGGLLLGAWGWRH